MEDDPVKIAYEKGLEDFADGELSSTYQLYRAGFASLHEQGWRIVKFTDELIDVETADGTIAKEWIPD